MLVIAHHDISDPEGFWTAAKETTNSLPGNLKLHGVYPSMDAKMGTCLWEAGSVQEVQQFLDKNAGMYAKNSCYEVNVMQSVGLPMISLAEEHLN